MWPTSCAASWRMRLSAAWYGSSRLLVAGDVRRGQPFEDQVVLPIAQRAERDGALDDLAGARIGDRSAGAPAARRAVDPVDHVVADVHRIGAVGQHRDLEAVAEAGRFERLVPPARAFDQRLLHVFGRARIDPVLDRLHRIADRARSDPSSPGDDDGCSASASCRRSARCSRRRSGRRSRRADRRSAACSCCRAVRRTSRCSRSVTASAVGVTLATEPENRPPPRPPPPPPARPPPFSGIGPGPWVGPAPPPPRPPPASLTKVSVISISLFLGNALVRGR